MTLILRIADLHGFISVNQRCLHQRHLRSIFTAKLTMM